MPLTDDFDGAVAFPVLFSVTTANGAGVNVPIQGIENVTCIPREFKKDNYTTISGTRAGKEQALLCSEKAGEYSLTMTYEAAHHSALDVIAGQNGCQIILTFSDGSTSTAKGGIEKLATERMEDSKHITDTVTVAANAGWTWAAGTPKTIVQAYTVSTVSGTATIDLTACGSGGTVNLTGKRITKLVLTAAVANGADITVAKGASNGYDVGGSFTETIPAGQSRTLEGTAASDTVGGSKKILDVTGTGADDVTVYIEAVTA